MKERTVDTLIIGSGAAAYNAADELLRMGCGSLLLATEGRLCGTSRNTGSDKQTYYKLSLSGDGEDSVRAMALDLFNGKTVDGPIALAEAAGSVFSFMKLALLGVPFPSNRLGEYVGYKTDHDPRCRATSVGPYTSKSMTEVLEASALSRGLEILDGWQLVEIITEGRAVRGAILLERKSNELMAVHCASLVLATGGPAGIYAQSVYPASQLGSTGLAFEAGCKGRNLGQWQFGLASVSPRWNVSGSYMQVLPRFVSIDGEGRERDFLPDYGLDGSRMLLDIFLKGYQWPFDVEKLKEGSSIIDVICFLECEKGRRVYLDFTHNPGKEEIDFDSLPAEARDYLESAAAIAPTPIERLHKLNEPAYRFYLDKGVDLEKDYLEIALCAQHNNGGIAVDEWWQTCIEGLYAVGEAAGTHGIKRPGGSALNSGQVGSHRAACHILSKKRVCKDTEAIDTSSIQAIINGAFEGDILLNEVYARAKERMSLYAGAIREKAGLEKALREVEEDLASFERVRVQNEGQIWLLFHYRNALISQKVYLSAMLDWAERAALSCGSALYSRGDGRLSLEGLDSRFVYTLDESSSPDIQETVLENGKVEVSYRQPLPLPDEDTVFERVWSGYIKDANVY